MSKIKAAAFAGAITLAASVMAAALATAASADPSPTSASLTLPAGMVGPTPSNRPALVNVTTWLEQGVSLSGGGCGFTPPKLRLAPDESAVEADQIGIDMAACTALWQIGTPTDTSTSTDGMSSDSAVATPSGGSVTSSSTATAATLHTTSAYAYAWQTDIINLTVNSVKSNLAWTWNGSCVQSSSGSTNWTWRSGTGWEPPTNKVSGIERFCGETYVHSDATYKNTGFCWPNTVYSKYVAVTSYGQSDGILYGFADENDHWGNGGCAPLYDHLKSVRVSG